LQLIDCCKTFIIIFFFLLFPMCNYAVNRCDKLRFLSVQCNTLQETEYKNHLQRVFVCVCVRTGIRGGISRKRLKVVPMDQVIGNGIWRINWSRDRRRHVTLKGRGHDRNIFGAHYLKNGLRYRLCYNTAPIENGLWVSNGHADGNIAKIVRDSIGRKHYLVKQRKATTLVLILNWYPANTLTHATARLLLWIIYAHTRTRTYGWDRSSYHANST